MLFLFANLGIKFMHYIFLPIVRLCEINQIEFGIQSSKSLFSS